MLPGSSPNNFFKAVILDVRSQIYTPWPINITLGEKKAPRWLLNQKESIINPLNKGGNIVIMNCTEYVEEAMPKDPTNVNL